MNVCKFGGSSLADAAQVKKVCRIVAADAQRRLVVVSAPGKRSDDDTKVTDLLIACGETVLRGENASDAMALVVERFATIHRELSLPQAVMD